MSLHINRNNDRVNIIKNDCEIKGVKRYGKVSGTVAKLMGIAEKIQDENNQEYYVNLRSLGKAWKKEKDLYFTRRENETGIGEFIEDYFQIRQGKKEAGKEFIGKFATENGTQKKIENVIKTLFYGREDLKTPIIAELFRLKWDESNLTKIYDKIKEFVDRSDFNSTKILFPETINDYGKLELLQAFAKHLKDGINTYSLELANKLQENYKKVEELLGQDLARLQKPIEGELSPPQRSQLKNIVLKLGLDLDTNNIDEVYQELKNKLSELEFKNLDTIFQESADGYEKLAVIKAFRSYLFFSQPLAQEKLVEPQTPDQRKAAIKDRMRSGVNDLFLKYAQSHPIGLLGSSPGNLEDAAPKEPTGLAKQHTLLSKALSSLRWDRSNQSAVFEDLKIEMLRGHPYGSTEYSGLEQFFKNLTGDEELELIQLCKNRANASQRKSDVERSIDLAYTALQPDDIKEFKKIHASLRKDNANLEEVFERLKNKMLYFIPIQDKKTVEDLLNSLDENEKFEFLQNHNKNIQEKLDSK